MTSEIFPSIWSRRTVVAAGVFFGLSVSLFVYKAWKKRAVPAGAPAATTATDTATAVALVSAIPFTDTTMAGRIYSRYLLDSSRHAYGVAVLSCHADTSILQPAQVYAILRNAGASLSLDRTGAIIE